MFGTRKKKNTKENNSSINSVVSSGKKSKSTTTAQNNRIGQGTKIEGEISSAGTIRIDGQVDGFVESKSRVIVGQTAIINGDVVCESLDISGKIKGKVQVKDTTTVASTAVIDGDIITDKLVMESGASFNGNIKTRITSTVQNSMLGNNDKPQSNTEQAKKAV